MVSLSREGVAVGFAFLVYKSSTELLAEYMPLYMKQLGFTAVFIGLVSTLGLLTQTLGTTVIGFVADKFRARKLVLFVVLLFTIPISLLFLAPRTPRRVCETSATGYPDGENGTVTPEFLRKSNWINVTHTAKHSVNRSSSVRPTEVNQLPNQTVIYENDLYKLFLIFLCIRGIYELLKRLTITFLTVTAMTHVKNDKSKYGFYLCWGEFGAGLTLFIVSIVVFQLPHLHCGKPIPSYYIAYLFTAGLQCLTLLSLPWLKFEYLERRVANFVDVKGVLLDPHYLLVLLICAHCGLCTTFQMRWEFWYMEHLGGGSLVIAVGGLIRHPMIATWFLLSSSVINRLGEIYVMAISLFLFSTSFAGLAFIRNPWLVIFFDVFQSIAYALFYSAVVVHFAKAGSKSSSAVIQGIAISTYSIGKEVGSALTGWLFTSEGTTITLCAYSIVTAVYLAIWMVYIFAAKDLDAYMEIPSEDETEDETE